MFYGGPDPITLNKMATLVKNVRSLSIGSSDTGRPLDPNQDPRRDLDDECGYPKHQWSCEEYKYLIDREPLACLLNEIEALESWKQIPSLYEDDDENVTTDFEYGWDELPYAMGVEKDHFEAGQGSNIWSTILCADIHCGEGRHGIILVSYKDGKDWSEPVTPRQGLEVRWMRSYPEYLARVTSFDTDPSSDRYMLPMIYDVQFSDPYESAGSGVQENYTTQSVHWSRVVHLCDRWHTAPTTINFSVPRIRPVRDPLLDYRKVRGSSAEMYYKAAFVGLHFGTHPQLGADVNVDTASLKDMYEEYINGLQRAIYTNGMTVDQLTPGVVDPNPQLLAQVQSIAMKKRIPMRILMGSERGELASGDDKVKWNDWMSSRRTMHNGPGILHPLVNRFINLGVLPAPRRAKKSEPTTDSTKPLPETPQSPTRQRKEPNGRVKTWWPDISSLTERERVDILLVRTQAYKEYVANDLQGIIPPLNYMTKFDNMDKEEAEVIIEDAEEAQAEIDEENAALAKEMGMDPVIDGFEKPQPDPIELETEKAKAKAEFGSKPTKNTEGE